jgi:hypothetical protein
MTENENQFASRIVHRMTMEALLEDRVALHQSLAAVAFKLIEATEAMEAKPTPITITMRTAYNEFRDDGYTGGYVASQFCTVVVSSSYFTTAYLGALANQLRPIETAVINDSQSSRSNTRSYSSVDLISIVTSETSESSNRLNSIRDAFSSSRQEAHAIVDALRESVEVNNPYKDIPIKIDWTELGDVMLRREILRYCESYDPNFHVHEINLG